MTEESRVSRTPRTWQTEDPEPPDDVEVLSKESEPGWFLIRGRPGWFWSNTGYRSERPGYSWASVSKVGQPGALVEVLPDAPESQPEDVEHDDLADQPLEDRSTWAKRRARLAGEGAPVAGCGCCDFLSKPTDGSCVYCDHRTRDHRHYDAVPVPGSSSEVSSVSPEGETTPGEGEERTETLRARWFPVVDDTIGGWAISNVDLPVSQLDTRDGTHFTVGNFLSEDIARHICDLHNAHLSPLPDSETEWGYRYEHWTSGSGRATDETDARAHLVDPRVTLLKRRAAGPWIEVQSGGKAEPPCLPGECNRGMCGGTSDYNGPCGGCCGCLGGCLDAHDLQLVDECSDASGDNG